MTSLISFNEKVNITAPFPTSVNHNGLTDFTRVRTYFPLRKQVLHIVSEASIQNTRQYCGPQGADAALD